MTSRNAGNKGAAQDRYWPTGQEPPRLPDGTIDIRALCRLWDALANAGLDDEDVPHDRP